MALLPPHEHDEDAVDDRDGGVRQEWPVHGPGHVLLHGTGARTTVRINRAMNVAAEQAEFEVERKRNAANFHGSSYDLVKVEGKLRVFSRQAEPVKLEVTKELSGEVLSTDPDAKDTATAKGLKQVNPRHVLTWEISAEPNKELILSYTYSVYVRG